MHICMNLVLFKIIIKINLICIKILKKNMVYLLKIINDLKNESIWVPTNILYMCVSHTYINRIKTELTQ